MPQDRVRDDGHQEQQRGRQRPAKDSGPCTDHVRPKAIINHPVRFPVDAPGWRPAATKDQHTPTNLITR
jgi:hypothetical protein